MHYIVKKENICMLISKQLAVICEKNSNRYFIFYHKTYKYFSRKKREYVLLIDGLKKKTIILNFLH